MIDKLTSKRTVLVLVLATASVVLVSGSREWVAGSVDDVVLGPGALHGRGSEVAPGAMAAALVGMAAAVVAATSGRVVRVVAACSALLAGLLGAAVVLSVLLDPGSALGRLAAAGTGRSGTLEARGQAGAWAWVALAATMGMAVGGLGALVGRRRWRGLSSRYDAAEPVTVPQPAEPAPPQPAEPAPPQPAEPAPPASTTSIWDQISRGEDPTAGR